MVAAGNHSDCQLATLSPFTYFISRLPETVNWDEEINHF